MHACIHSYIRAYVAYVLGSFKGTCVYTLLSCVCMLYMHWYMPVSSDLCIFEDGRV